MRYEIVFAPEAIQDLMRLSARDRSTVRDALERHLRHAPERRSRSSIKRLRGLSQPQYRLRVGDIRVFYDVVGQSVQVLAIVAKSDARAWLEEMGKAK
jgi:mRNA-degrading endonuclease RelE of RelBE toxin-antitoxin system